MSTKRSIEFVDAEDRRPSVIQIVEPQSGSTPVGPEPSTDFETASSASAPFGGLQTSYGLLSAFDRIARRGSGECSWAAPLDDDPIAFLLDSISDAANLWTADGARLCRNRASIAFGLISFVPAPICTPEGAVEAFSVEGRRYERRCLRCRIQAADYVLEVIRKLP
jgi:hypothetical protein